MGVVTGQPIRRKLIEVALPLEAINVAAAKEKSSRRGHPSTLHLWWARRPLAACRAVLFSSLVDDPSSVPQRFPTPKAVEDERTRLFGIIERLVQWENASNEEVIEEARAEIRLSTGGNPPPVLDPFCGGGSIPLEAQRLGLTAYASDLNPVAVLITKALVEIPPKFANRPPVHPDARRGVGSTGAWEGAAGLAEDVRRYGTWMRNEAERRIGHLYPKASVPGNELTVIAWLWARTVTCPNPACGARMPLARSFVLSKKKGKEAWVEPIIDRAEKSVRFEIRTGRGVPSESPKVGRGAAFRCLVCDQVAGDDHIKAEGTAKRMDAQLMAIVAEGQRGRTYLSPTIEHEAIARTAEASWKPEGEIARRMTGGNCTPYGLTSWGDLFTPRQLVALTTFSDLVGEAREHVRRDAVAAGTADDGVGLNAGSSGATAYADALATYLALAVDRLVMSNNSLVRWNAVGEKAQHAFGRQGLPMIWDFAEPNPLGSATGGAGSAFDLAANGLGGFQQPASQVHQADASRTELPATGLVSTDPPYYDNIGYSDLSDFFYVWLRRSLAETYPDLFTTLLTPKAAELVAVPYRFGGDRAAADEHFEAGLAAAFRQILAAADPRVPVTIYYAFKQSESADDEEGGASIASTGWETMLEGLLAAGLSIEGTWPMRTEMATRQVAGGSNALASSIILVCRPRTTRAGITTRGDLVLTLKGELPETLRTLQHGNIAPVDLAQASIGPGMAIYSRYAKVLETDGSTMRVRTALALINQVLDEVLAEQEGEFDADTRWAIAWYEQFGLTEADSGRAILLTQAKDTSLSGLEAAGIVEARRGKTRLLTRPEYSANWDPAKDARIPVWEATQRLVHVLLTEGEAAAGDLLARLGGLGETARDLAYRLYNLAERKGWTDEARAYNSLVVAWTDLARGAESARVAQPAQSRLGLE